MKMRSPAVFVILVALSTAFLVSCGPQAAPGDGKVTVTLGYNAYLSDSFTKSPPPIDVIRAELAKKYPEITLEYFVMPLDLLETLVIWMTSKDSSVDIFGLDVPWVTQFGTAGWARDLKDLVPGLASSIGPGGLTSFTHNDKVLAVPFWGGVSGLYYRKDILDSLGLAAPGSLDDMVAAIVTAKKTMLDLDGFLWPGAKEESLAMFYSTLLYAYGGNYTNTDGTLSFTSPAGQQALDFIARSVEKGWSPQGVRTWTRMEARQHFLNGKALFHWDNHDLVTTLDNKESSAVAGLWGIMPFPAQPGGRSVAISGGFGFALNPNSRQEQAAARVLEVIASYEVQKGFAMAWGPVQYAPGLYDDPEVQASNPHVELLSPLIKVAINRMPSPRYAELSAIMLSELNGLANGIKTPQEAGESLQSLTKDLVGN